MTSKPNFQLFSSLRYDPMLISLPANAEYLAPANIGIAYYMLPFHRDRMLQAAEYFNWTVAASKISGAQGLSHLLETLNEAIGSDQLVPLKVRTVLSQDGEITVETNPVPAISRFNLYPEKLPPPSSAAKEVKVSPLTGGALTLGENDGAYGSPERAQVYDVIPNTTRTTPSPYTSYKTTSREMYTDARERVGILDFDEKKEVLIVSDQAGEIMEGSLTSVYFWRDGNWITPPVSSGGQIGTTRRWLLEKGMCVENVVKIDELVDGEECWISNGVRGLMAGKVKLS